MTYHHFHNPAPEPVFWPGPTRLQDRPSATHEDTP